MKILKDFAEKIKCHKEEIFLISLIVLSGFFGFGLGRLSKIKERKIPVSIEYGPDDQEEVDVSSESAVYFVASRNGKKYYFPCCEGAKRINQENLVKFDSRESAESAEYDKASNCAGL